MALTDNSNNASQTQAKTTNNLLDFVNIASSNIQEALAPKKKRPVNVRKYIQKRVKRLNNKPARGQTKTKSVPKTTKPNSAQLLHSVGSLTWPLLNTAPVSEMATVGMPTRSYPTSPSYSYTSEPSMYAPTDSKIIDPELDSLLSEFGLECQPEAHHSSDSFQATVSRYTPSSTLESQVYLGEHPYSPPNSDCSDELLDDSVYSSPVGSVGYRSTACSPPIPSCNAEWPVHSPPSVATTQCPISSTVWFQEQPVVSGSGWLPQYPSFDQGPPMTPTVSELFLDTAFC